MNKARTLRISGQIQLLEKLTGLKVLMFENEAADKNFAVEAMQRVSESLDNLRNDTAIAIDKVASLPQQDIVKGKLKGLSAIIEAALTDVAECITSVTGMQTDNGDQISEDVEMTSDDVIKDIDNVKKLADKDIDVIVNDDAKDPNH